MFPLLSEIVQVQNQLHGNGVACTGETALAMTPTELVQSLPSVPYSLLENIEDICLTNQPGVKESCVPAAEGPFTIFSFYVTVQRVLILLTPPPYYITHMVSHERNACYSMSTFYIPSPNTLFVH